MARIFLNVSNNVSRIYRDSLFVTTAIVLIGIAASPASAQSASADAGATALEPIVIQGASSDSKTDRTSVAAKNSSAATKINTPLVETPRSVSVTTEKEIEQRGAQSIIEAVRYSAGVTTGPNGFDPRFDQIFIRGFNVTTVGDYRDSLRQPYINYGMMMPGVELQSSFLKDLVTPVLPTSRWSFVSYLVAHKRLYAFLNANYNAVPRQEFARYLAWVANGVDGLRFGTEIRDVEHRDDRFFLRFDNGQEEARNLVIGTGSSPFVPDWAKPFLGADCFHNSEAKSRLSDLGAARIVVVGGGQSGGEVVEALLADPGSMK